VVPNQVSGSCGHEKPALGGAVTGSSLQDFAAKFNVPLDKLASMLGTDMTELQA
jgi:hypothetical protein